MSYKEIENFCEERGFLFHKHGSGTFGADRYWTYCKVEDNNRTLFSIEYFPVVGMLKVKSPSGIYQGVPKSLSHMKDILSVMCVEL